MPTATAPAAAPTATVTATAGPATPTGGAPASAGPTTPTSVAVAGPPGPSHGTNPGTPGASVGGESIGGHAMPHDCGWTGVLLPVHQQIYCPDSERDRPVPAFLAGR